jgi:hypothetical protein
LHGGGAGALSSPELELMQETLNVFTKRCMAEKRCQRCKAYAPGLRKEGHAKIFLVRGSPVQRSFAWH